MTTRTLPPDVVLESGGIDPADVRSLPWDQPVWVIESADGRIVLGARGGRTDEMLDWERALLDALERTGFPSSRSAPIFGGRDYVAVGDVHYVARSWIPGRMLFDYENVEVRAVGAFIAAYHDAVEMCDMQQRPGIGSLVDALNAPTDGDLRHCLGSDEDVGCYRRAVDEVEEFPLDGLRLVVHGDFTTRNIVARGAVPQIVGLIDFGMAMLASPEVELAYALGSARPDFGQVEHIPELVTDLIAGYTSRRPLGMDAAPRIVDHARWRPLLNIAVRAVRGDKPRSVRALDRAMWLTEHRAETIAAIERGNRIR